MKCAEGVLTSKDDCLGCAAVALPVNEAGGDGPKR